MATARRTGTNENISTYGTAGRDYTSLATWEAATDNDLVTATTSEVLECYDDAVFSDTVILAGATTDASYHRIIRPAAGQGHDGTPGTGIRIDRASSALSSGGVLIGMHEDYSKIQDISLTAARAEGVNTFALNINASNVEAVGVIIHDFTNPGAGVGFPTRVQGGADDVKLIDCLVINSENNGFEINSTATGTLLYNCTSVNATVYGFLQGSTSTPIIKNCVATGSGTSDYSGTFAAGSTNNVSSDATAQGTINYQSATVTYVDASADNFLLHRNDLGATFRGTDLSADGSFAFDDDITGGTITYWNAGISSLSSPQSARRTGDNENISTYGTAGRDYTALATWEAATDNDLVTATTTEVLEVYDDATFDDYLEAAGAITDGRYFRIVRAADITARPHFSVTVNPQAFYLNENNFSVQDIDADVVINSAGDGQVFSGDAVSNLQLVSCRSVASSNAGAGDTSGFDMSSSSTTLALCVASNHEGFGFASNGSNSFYGCVAADNTLEGFYAQSALTTAKNCIATNNGGGGFIQDTSWSADTTHNVSSGATAPGTVNYQNQTVTYTGTAGGEFHLHRNDLGATFRGTDLSTDPTFALNDDIDGDTITYWNIGADSSSTPQSARRTGDNENISTYGSAGRDYTSLAVWEAATDNDLITATTSEVLELYNDAVFDDNITLAGAITDAKYFRILRPATGEAHNGTPNTGVRFSNNGGGSSVFSIAEDYASIQDIVATLTANNTSTSIGSFTVTAGTEASVIGCISLDAANAGSGAARGIQSVAASGTSYFIDCMAIGSKNAGFASITASTDYLYNCTATNNGTQGIVTTGSSTIIAKNCLAKDNSSGDFVELSSGSFDASSTTNASADTSAPGSSPRISQPFTFINEAADNLHLHFNDTGAKGFGTDLSTDVFFNFNDDIDSSTVSVWSIGADSDPLPLGGGAYGSVFRRRRRTHRL